MATSFGPEYGVKFTMVPSPEVGTSIAAVFNDESSSDYVGILDPNESSGLDSPEIREDSQMRTEAHGAIQSPSNYFGPRPVILAGIIRASTVEQRNERASKLITASHSMTDTNSRLEWTPKGGVALSLQVRKQQPVRITGGYVKKFQIPLVAADPRILGPGHFLEAASGVAMEPENIGNWPASPFLHLFGPQTNPVIKNETTGEEIKLTYSLASGKEILIDTFNHTVYEGASNIYGAWNFAASKWFTLNANGKTKLKCTTGKMGVTWSDTFM